MKQLVNVKIITDYISANRLTKREFCKQCKIGVSTFYKIMQGKNVNVISLFRIAKKLDIPLYRFFVFPN